MRSRSHRLQVSEPRHDDWVDGSWTVDCVCGVNFDDGEEMVDCDECGVWVHTRCARYVKSDKSFACDKCKSKNSGGSSSGVRNDSEETEVAEFLVELPTKTLRMDNPNPASLPARMPFRLWTEIPMEERVHVQGVPGGDPGLFSGVKMSSAFGPELWKCTGYVPKKFNFRYNEFECLDPGKDEEKREEKDRTNGQENAKQTDNCAGVLFSLLTVNENPLPSPAVNSVGVSKSPIEGGGSHEVESPAQLKLDTQNVVSDCPGDGIKKDNSSVRIVFHTGKRKKQEQQKVKDQYVKKKARTAQKEGDVHRRVTHSSKGVVASTFSSDAKHLKFSGDRGSKVASDDIKCGKNILVDQLSVNLGECATNLASNEHSVEATLRNDVSGDEISRQGNSGNQVPVGSESFAKTNNGLESLVDINGSHVQSLAIKGEVPGEILQRCGDASGNGEVGIDSCDREPVAAEVKITDQEAKVRQDDRDSDVDDANSHPNKKLESEQDTGDPKLQHSLSLPSNDLKSDTIKATTQYFESVVNKVYLEEGKVVEASVMNAEASDRKVLGGSRSQITGNFRIEKSLNDPYQSKREPTGSEGPMGARKKSSEFKHGSEVTDELPKSNGTARSHSTASYRHKAVVSVVKSTSNTGGTGPKSSENHSGPTSPAPPVHNRQKESSQNSMGTMKDSFSSDAIEHDGKSSRPRKLVKESSRLNSMSKISESTKQLSDSRKLPSDPKDLSKHSSSKVPLPANGASSHISRESASPPPLVDGSSNVQNKVAASAGPGKCEKLYHSSHTSSRGNVALVTAPASSQVAATLSDEELALLLHQELNSSPRVPRVPRMRHGGCLPQLSSSTATSMLIKRTCSSGAKDSSMATRRRTKDGEGSHGSVEVDNEARKMERKPSLPDSRRQDSGCSVDPLCRRENLQPVKKLSSTVSSSSDANGHNVSSTRASSRNASDDDRHAVGRRTSHTLPGLIAEIMSEGKRMTYEELCNAVLPHWPHLRKHNGERYAYSSHSQAVLDCLRNRSEWARLVDRGPKTSGSRKRRKLDTDYMSIESQDDEENAAKNAKDVGSKSFESHREDFPKGKRKARKRRRLALQGRRVVRRRRRAEVVSDDESESFSDSSEESESSEEEIQGGGTSMAGSEVSTSSDE